MVERLARTTVPSDAQTNIQQQVKRYKQIHWIGSDVARERSRTPVQVPDVLG